MQNGVYNPTDIDELEETLDELHAALKEDGLLAFERARNAALKDKPRLQKLLTGVTHDEQEQDRRITHDENGDRVLRLETEDDIDVYPDMTWLIDGYLPSSGVTLLYGESSVGKTFLAVDVAQHIARGWLWQGRQTRQGYTLHVYAEGRLGLKPRLQAWRKAHHDTPKTSNTSYATYAVQLVEESELILNTVKEQAEQGMPFSLIIIDTFSNCATGTNQNAQDEVAKALVVAHKLVELYQCQVLIVHHTNKDDKFNGSQAFKNHVDTMIKLSQENETAPILMCCEKQRDGEAKFHTLKLRLEVIPLGLNENKERMTSCVVVSSDDMTRNEKQEQARYEQAEQEKETMLDILRLHGTLSTRQWMKYCHDEDIATKPFNRHTPELLAEGKVSNDDTGKNGATIHWSLCREIPLSS